MIDILEYRPERVEIDTVTGSVAGVTTRTVSTQNISTSGGTGGFYVGNVRFDDPVRVTSTTDHTNITEFFLLTDNGKELPVRLKNIDFQVRDGHVVSLQTISLKGGPSTMLAIGNHTTGASHENPRWGSTLFTAKPKIGCLLGIVLALAGISAASFVTTIMFAISSALGSLLSLAILGIPVAVWVYMRRVNDRSTEWEEMRDDVMTRAARQFVDEERRLAIQD